MAGKGDRHRSINGVFKNNFDNIKWGERESSLVKIETPTGTKYVSRESLEQKPRSHHIMPDIEPYMAKGGDGGNKEWITSRSQEREYLKRNNCIQVGNEKDYFFKYNGKTPDNPTREWKK